MKIGIVSVIILIFTAQPEVLENSNTAVSTKMKNKFKFLFTVTI